MFLLAGPPLPLRADSLEDAARALARKAASVPQRDRRFYLDWQNHSSIAAEQSEALRESFTDEIRIIASPRAALAAAATSTTALRLLKELLWQQREPILDAVEPGDEANKQNLFLLLNRENIALYHRKTDHWELQDTKPIYASEKPMRDLRGELQFSPGRDKQNNVALPGKICDLDITEQIELNCRPATQTWSEGMFIASPCNRGVSWLRAESGDWSVPDRLLLQNPSLPNTAASIAELDLPGPMISISSGQATRSGYSFQSFNGEL